MELRVTTSALLCLKRRWLRFSTARRNEAHWMELPGCSKGTKRGAQILSTPVIYSHEVKGGRGRNLWQMTNFRRTLEDCELSDLSYEGYPFSFLNRRKGKDEELDRAMVNERWRRLFPKARARFIVLLSSDHLVMLIDTSGKTKGRRKRMFRFEEMWLKHPEFKKDLHEFWASQRGGSQDWSAKLMKCKQYLKKWNSKNYGDIRKRIETLKNEMEIVRMKERTEEVIVREKELVEELDEWLAEEEVMWKQRARVEWTKYGDKTRLTFTLELYNGEKETRFTNSLMSEVDWEKELIDIRPRITTEMNDMFSREVTEEEIRKVVFQLGATKAPDIDGDINLNPSWNITQIVLIPKVKDVTKMTDLRSINLCNVSMKVITKVLANRLQPILGEVISSHQSPFVKNRMIFDNFIIAHEMAHFIRGCKNKKKGYASLKLDMSKSYDRIEWGLLEKILRRMGFSELWIRWIMLCVSTVKYRVKFNDFLTDEITPRRGLRQRDPLSPYLFILCMELLDAKLSEGVNKGLISGVLGVKEVVKHGRYLVLPLIVGQRRCDVFKELVEKMWKKTTDWKHELLSIAGREVLVKSVLQSLPLYSMAVFIIPQRIRDEMTRVMLNFWWGNKEVKGIHWISRKILMEPKENGGLGFRDLNYFNEALVMRLCWRVIRFPNLLLSRVLKG
ncbi:hypothetical protein QQ045_029361 [Rhodiola kirilowii]